MKNVRYVFVLLIGLLSVFSGFSWELWVGEIETKEVGRGGGYSAIVGSNTVGSEGVLVEETASVIW